MNWPLTHLASAWLRHVPKLPKQNLFVKLNIVIVFLDSIPVFAFHLIVFAHINTFNLQANVFLIEEDDYQTAAQNEKDANSLSRGEP